MPLDETRRFLPVNIAVLTVSDSRDLASDRSGQTLQELIERDGHRVASREIVKDEVPAIEARLRAYIQDAAVDCVISTGGTGITGRDVTPEAYDRVLEKRIDGFGELFRWISYGKIKTSAMQSRALGGVANGTYLFALPGSPGACRDGWEEILRFQLDSRWRPCNLVELMPRWEVRVGTWVRGPGGPGVARPPQPSLRATAHPAGAVAVAGPPPPAQRHRARRCRSGPCVPIEARPCPQPGGTTLAKVLWNRRFCPSVRQHGYLCITVAEMCALTIQRDLFPKSPAVRTRLGDSQDLRHELPGSD